MITGIVRLLRRRVTAAVLGQVTQAAAGVVLQVAAARELGAGGLATFSVAYGAIVLATAICSGLVGDSLTVLSRTDPGIRAGLLVCTAGVVVVAGACATAVGVSTDALPVWASIVAGMATGVFIIEDTLRRLLMAVGRFGRLPSVDLTSLAVALGVLAVASVGRDLALSDFIVALFLGQTAASVVAWVQLPAPERPRGPWRRPSITAVVSFGTWRAAAQAIRPTLLTLVRLTSIAIVGATAYGPVEAARIYAAPTLILVAGIGTFLLPHFVATVPAGAARALRSADRAAALLGFAVAGVGAVAALALPLVGPWVVGEEYLVPLVPVVGWSAYAVASAVLLPYASLASVLRRQRRVLALRSLEVVSIGIVLLLLTASGSGAQWAPLALTTGPLLAAAAVRWTVLLPLTRSPAGRERPDGDTRGQDIPGRVVAGTDASHPAPLTTRRSGCGDRGEP
ncbi:hypothetical protein [Geodermatophilus sp. Leaf369]|uniref:hypothetical protein n=1 Tax=Geodermatophilus sp. Leaf369 TaxID=1736354 RepID=UPI000A567BF3|nr:hypothetical protein [Geodermatophilus sp. Leaf369]